jgi:basic membrane lipoprotein Med (substrate-binding protein (PBP1-ABC) superfamily)
MMHRTFCGILFIVALSSCSGIGDNATSLATLTLMVTPNGLGDNGYNDAAAEGIFAFAEETGTRLRLLLPGDEPEAEQLYRQWLTENAAKDSSVLILGSSAYEGMARKYRAELSGKGSRVLLFDSNAAIDGISSVMVSHYGVSYLAGAMSQGFNALVLAASEGIPSLEESIEGYQDARKAHAGEYDGLPCKTTLHYLADGEEGFAMPDSAYRYIARRAKSSFLYNEMIFPLLGGSQAGILRYLNDDEFSAALMAGMDVDQTGQSSRIPFSVVIRIGDVLNQYLTDWSAGREWPASQRLGMKDGAADIVITPRFKDHLVVWDNRYASPDTFQRLYEQYREEAMIKEEAYEQEKKQ